MKSYLTNNVFGLLDSEKLHSVNVNTGYGAIFYRVFKDNITIGYVVKTAEYKDGQLFKHNMYQWFDVFTEAIEEYNQYLSQEVQR